MKTYMSASANRQHNLLRTPDDKRSLRVSSNDRFIGRSVPSTNHPEHPTADTNARYSICYLPGASEHNINTGNTLVEAQMKVVMFACEVERLTSQNYELVKENEVLRTQTDKSQREKDLETKLAIVLAENEKLNQVIEELYEMYLTKGGADAPDGYENRISELLQDLEEWKQRYQNLQVSQGGSDFQNALAAFEDENQKLREAIGDRDRDLELLRARLQAAGTTNEVIILEEKIHWLAEENNQLKDDLRNSRAPGNNNRLIQEYREKMSQLIDENENLKDLLQSHIEQNEGQRNQANKSPIRGGVNFSQSPARRGVIDVTVAQNEQQAKRAVYGEDNKPAMDADKLRDKVDILLGENERLNNVIQKQITQIEEYRKSNDWVNKMHLITLENERLNQIILDQINQIDQLKKQATSGAMRSPGNGRIESLNNQINDLLEKNEKLNDLTLEKDREVDELRRRLGLASNASPGTVIVSNVSNVSRDDSAEYKGKLMLLTQENERLNNLLISKIQELDKLKADTLDAQLSVYKIEQLNNTVKALSDENQKLNDIIFEKNKEIDRLRLSDAGSGINTVQWRIDDLNREKEILNSSLQDKAKELEDVRKRLYDLQADSSNVEQLKSRIVWITEENERLNNNLLEKIRELETAKNSLLSFGTSEYKIRDLEERLGRSNNENERLNRDSLDRLREIENLKTKIFTLENSSNIIDDLKSKTVLLMAEVERLNANIAQRNAEIDQLTIRVSNDQTESLKFKVQGLVNENERLNAQLLEKFREIEELRRRLSQLESSTQVIELSTRVESLMRDLDRLRISLGEKDSEINSLRRRIGELEGNTAVIIELQGKLKITSDENKRLLDELDTLRRRLAQDRTAELELRVRDLAAEKELVNNLLQSKMQEAEGYRRELEHLRSQHVETVNTLNVNLTQQKEELKSVAANYRRKSSDLDIKDKQVEELEDKIRRMENEIQRLAFDIREKESEIYSLRQISGQYDSLQARYNILAQEKAGLENTINSNYRELDALKAKAALVERLDGELRGVRDNLEAVLKQSEEYRKRIFELENTAGRVRELENALEVLRGENGILRKSLEDKNRHISDLDERARLAITEKDRIAYVVEDKTREIESIKRKASNEIETAKQASTETIQLERTRSNGERDILKRRIENLVEENERIKNYSNQTLADLEELKKKYLELERLRSQEIAEFRAQFETLKDINREIKDLQLKSAAERTAYETQLAQYEMVLEDAQRQNKTLSSENERLNALNSKRLEELERLRRQNVEVEESSKLEIVELRSQIEQFKANAHDIKQLAIKYSADRAADQAFIKQLQQLNENFKAEIEKLYKLLDERKADIEGAQKQNEALRVSQAQLVLKLKQNGGDDRLSIERFDILQNQLRELENARNEYKIQADRNSVELTRRNKELVDKIQQVDVLKLKYEEAFANYQALNFKLFERLSI